MVKRHANGTVPPCRSVFMLTQLQTPIPLETPKGKAWAVAIIDYGPQWDLQWVTFIHGTGECWTFRNSEIRQPANYTFGLSTPTQILPNLPEPSGPRPPAPTNVTPMRPAFTGVGNVTLNV
jgi:hypothetical protein